MNIDFIKIRKSWLLFKHRMLFRWFKAKKWVNENRIEAASSLIICLVAAGIGFLTGFLVGFILILVKW